MVSLRPDLSRRARSIMTVGARLRSKAASSLPRCGPLARGRGRTEGDEEAAAILEHLESGAEAAESEGSARRPESRGARRVHLAVLPERYEPLEEQVPSEKPKKRYRKKLKKYGKVGIQPPPVPWVGHPTSARELKSDPYSLTLSASLPCPAPAPATALPPPAILSWSPGTAP